MLPNWREQLACDCEDRLASRPRALLHFLGSVAAAQPWSRALLFGPPAPTDRRVAAMVGAVTAVERLTEDHRLPLPSGAFHLALASEALHLVPPLDTAMAEIRRVLAPGGEFAFTVPFRNQAAGTQSALDRLPRVDGRLPSEVGFECHEIGWDILPRLRRAGFAEASAYVYWSRELGYFGPLNVIFGAVA
jgi:SAM-dependent methyltransferase